MRHLKIDSHAALDWNSFCYEVTLNRFENQAAIGEKDVHLEIDETSIPMRKFERGKVFKAVWVFEWIERNSNKKFIVLLLKDSEDPENII